METALIESGYSKRLLTRLDILARTGEHMRVNKNVKKCIAFLGIETENGGFSVEGTAFLASYFEEECAFMNLVTAAHILKDFPDVVSVRLNRKDGTPGIIRTKKTDWFPHPDSTVDIAVFPVADLFAMGYDVLTVDLKGYPVTDEIIKERGFSEGDEVFIAGAYVSRIGTLKNLPIIRVGTIASMAIEPIWPASKKLPAYLVEVRSIGGLSGSPVFVQQPIVEHKVGKAYFNEVEQHEFILGVVLGYHIDSRLIDRIKDDDEEPDIDFPEFNTGITVVQPIQQVLETLEIPLLKELRMKAIEKHKKESGMSSI